MAYISDLLEKIFGRLFDYFPKNTYVDVFEEEETKQNEEADVNMQTIRGLLNDLDICFDDIQRKTQLIETTPDQEKLLKVVGPTIIPSHYKEEHSKTVDHKNLPAIIYLLNLNAKDIDSEDDLAMRGFYAIKTERFPWFVSPMEGTLYEIGIFLPDRLKRQDVAFYGGYLSITKEGEIEFPKVCYLDQYHVGRHTYNQKNWRHQYLLSTMKATQHSPHETQKEHFQRMFATYFNLHKKTRDFWKVSAKKEKSRATFLIEKSRTKYFFKDREVEALTPSGQKKKIIHYVKEHRRRTKNKRTTVREHLRGIRQFTWNDYFCSVVAPKLHSFDINDFDAASVDPEDNKERGLMSGAKAMKILSEIEDNQAY